MTVYIQEIDIKVWLDVDIDVILSLALTNKYSYKLLQEKQFWLDKYHHDKIILYDTQYTIGKWVKNYKHIVHCMDMANKILIIAHTESNTNDYWKTEGCIRINITDKNRWNTILYSNALSFLNNATENHRIYFIIDSNDYEFKVELCTNTTSRKGTQTLDYCHIHKIMTTAVYYNLPIKDTDFGISYIITDPDMKDYSHNAKLYAYRRFGYWELLNNNKDIVNFMLHKIIF